MNDVVEQRPRLESVVTRVGDLRAVAVLRVLIGAVVIRHLWPDLRADVVPVERFHVPWWSWLPEPSTGGYRALVWVGVAAGAAMIVGVAARAATAVAAGVVAYLLFVDMTGFAHNRGYLVWLLVGLAVVPRGPRIGLARIHRGQGNSTGVVWPVTMLRVVASSIYLTSGLTKLANPDWRSGLVLWDRVVRFEHNIPFGGSLYDALTARWFHGLLAPSAIAVEVLIGIGLWLPRMRLAAIWIAIVFHASIEVAASVQTFSYTAIAALLLWVTPSTRDRAVASCSPLFAAAVRRLDWLQRFDVRVDAIAASVTTEVVDRDGTRRRERDARLTVLSRLPALFPFVAPVLAFYRSRWARVADANPAIRMVSQRR